MDKKPPEGLTPREKLEQVLNLPPGEPVKVIPLTAEEEQDYLDRLDATEVRPPARMPLHLIANCAPK